MKKTFLTNLMDFFRAARQLCGRCPCCGELFRSSDDICLTGSEGFPGLRLKWLGMVAAVLVIGLFAGCATVPEATPAAREQALNFKPPPGEAGVYLIRPHHIFDWLSGRVASLVCLDQQKFTRLDPNSFYYTLVPPGKHTVLAGTGNIITFLAKKGQNYFITMSPSSPVDVNFNLISAEVGENDVRLFKMCDGNFYQFPFMPGPSDSTATAVCHIVLVQPDPVIVPELDLSEWPATGLPEEPIGRAGCPYGVNGFPAQMGEQFAAESMTFYFADMVDATVNAITNDMYQLKENNEKFRGYGLGESFGTNFQASLARAAATSPWFHAGSVDVTTGTTDRLNCGTNGHPILQINVAYGLAPYESSLFMRAELLYFRPGMTNAAYRGAYTYLSAFLPVDGRKAIARWTASDATLLRQRMSEGASELVKMIDLGFFHRAVTDPQAQTVFISSGDPLASMPATWRGYLLRSEGKRVIFQDTGGDLFSVIGRVTPQYD